METGDIRKFTDEQRDIIHPLLVMVKRAEATMEAASNDAADKNMMLWRTIRALFPETVGRPLVFLRDWSGVVCGEKELGRQVDLDKFVDILEQMRKRERELPTKKD